MVALTARRSPAFRHTTVTKGNLTFTLIERATP